MPIYRKGEGQMDGLSDRAHEERAAFRQEDKDYLKNRTPISPESATYRRSKTAGEHPEWDKVSDIVASGEDRPFSGAGLAMGNKIRKQDEEDNGALRAYQKNKEAKKMAREKGSGVLQAGKLVKGGNTHLKQDLERNGK